MSCRRISRWVLRHGSAEVPVEWREHIADCTECQRLIDDVGVLDTVLSKSDVPDPGEAYWDGFAPSVARRLEALSDTADRSPVIAKSRWAWIRAWAPAVGVAALAFLIGRELSHDYASQPVILDSDVVAQAETTPKAKADVPTELNVEEIASAVQPDRTSPGPAEVKEQETGPTIRERTDSDVPVMTAATDPPVESADEFVEDHVAKSESSTEEMAGVTDAITTEAPTITDLDDESSVWPDRRVLTLGQLGQDADEHPTMDDQRLAEQSSPGLNDRRASWAETSATPSALARLEGTRAYRSATLPDSQSPTEAMRRFDELAELQEQIESLESITSTDRTIDQTRELCAMWYRTGQITQNAAELETAIQRMDIYIVDLDDSLQVEWMKKKSQLVTRRASLIR